MSLKVVLSVVVGVVAFAAHAGLPTPFGDVASAALACFAYFADHNKLFGVSVPK